MAHRFFLSLTTISLILSGQAVADEGKKTPAEQQPAPQKRKPHFVGVKKGTRTQTGLERPPEKAQKSEE